MAGSFTRESPWDRLPSYQLKPMWPRQVLVPLFEQLDRLVATIKLISAGVYKSEKWREKGDCELKEINYKKQFTKNNLQ